MYKRIETPYQCLNPKNVEKHISGVWDSQHLILLITLTKSNLPAFILHSN